MPKCLRCNRFKLSFLLINGYCAKCFELNKKEAEHKRIREESERAVMAEKQRAFVQECSSEIKQPSEEKDKQLAADMEKFIAEQNALSESYGAPSVSAADQGTMTEEDIEAAGLLWFPEKEEIINMNLDDETDFWYGYLDVDFSRTLITLLEEWKNHPLIWKYTAFLELVWRTRDPHMLNALSVTAIEALGCLGDPVWTRFGYYLSDEFRAWINDFSIQGNVMLNYGRGIPRLTSLNGQNLPAYRLQPDHQVKEPRQENDVFMLGSYHIIDGRVKRFRNRPQLLQKACNDLGWVNIDSEYHRFVFRNEKGANYSVYIIFSRFPAGYLRENIVGAFLHSVLIIHQLIDAPESVGLTNMVTDIVHFSQSEDEWNMISAEQRYTDAGATLNRFYTDERYGTPLLDKNPETGTMELINTDYTDFFSRCDEQACKKMVSLLNHLPANTVLIGGNFETQTRITETYKFTDTYIGAEDDCFMTIITQEL